MIWSGGLLGIDTNEPGNRFLHGLFVSFLVGVLELMLVISISHASAKSLATCPLLPPSIPWSFATALQFIRVPVGQLRRVASNLEVSHVTLSNLGECVFFSFLCRLLVSWWAERLRKPFSVILSPGFALYQQGNGSLFSKLFVYFLHGLQFNSPFFLSFLFLRPFSL